MWSAVRPCRSVALMAAPFSSRYSHAITEPERMAACSAVRSAWSAFVQFLSAPSASAWLITGRLCPEAALYSR
uniref:Putative secreted protein n=1 Tax=Anopheles darlingi TaxID=43151 RepID=A0A2M4D0X8_ANODA